jgi:hypothetical protein
MNTPVNGYTNTASTSSVDSIDAASPTNTRNTDVFASISDLEVKMAVMYRHMRDALRQYNESQQKNAADMAKLSFDTKMASIQKDYDSGMADCNAKLAEGCIDLVGTAFTAYSGNELYGKAFSAFGQTAGSFLERDAKKLSKESMELGGRADYQHALAEAAEKRSDQTLDMARQASVDLKNMEDMISQIHDRITSALQRH